MVEKMSIQKIAASKKCLCKKTAFRQAKKQFKSKKTRVLCKKIAVGDSITLRNGLNGTVINVDLIRSIYIVTSTVTPQRRNFMDYDWYRRDGKSTVHKNLDIVHHTSKGK